MTKPIKMVDIPGLHHNDSVNFLLLAGPCVVESETITFEIAEKIRKVTDKLKIPFVFKASYRKANRSKHDSFTGIGDIEALEILKKVNESIGIPVVTDIHEPHEAELASNYVDMLQIPAFLCRQTDLLLAAGNTGKFVNIKKGQFLSGDTMKFAVDKVLSTGNRNILLTERGSMYGYNDLVVDYRNIPKMQQTGFPVIMDVTHSLQQPNQSSGVTGGNPEMIETMARAAIAVGADGIFLETHPNPAEAKSDGANMLKLDILEPLLEKLVSLRQTINRF
jgi:2-dehydro-3-deoxyphosphooctonate aldolase (KDO 8-P synthase)